MDGFVAVTDPGWYQQLSLSPGPKDANFWRPSLRAFRLDQGTPFFFKLRAPYRKIAGFGYFAGFTVLPDWLAWETFGESNGVPSLTELRDRLSSIQHGARIEADLAGRIGCCLIAEARFFQELAWVEPPGDWSPRTQTGTRINLNAGEGRRILAECLERTAASPTLPSILEDSGAGSRFGPPVLHAPRLGQSIFRIRVLDAYERACAVTGEHSLPVLDAAHIMPYSNGGAHAIYNGIVLRSDLHRLFDHGYVAIDEDHRFLVGDRLKRDFENGRSYYGWRGQPVTLPRDPGLRPSPMALRWHRDTVFLG